MCQNGQEFCNSEGNCYNCSSACDSRNEKCSDDDLNEEGTCESLCSEACSYIPGTIMYSLDSSSNALLKLEIQNGDINYNETVCNWPASPTRYFFAGDFKGNNTDAMFAVSENILFSINTTTCALTDLGTLFSADSTKYVTGMKWSTNQSVFFIVISDKASYSNLYKLFLDTNNTVHNITLVGNTNLPFVQDIAFDSAGILYAFEQYTTGFFTVDTATAKATFIGISGLLFEEYANVGMDYDPYSGYLVLGDGYSMCVADPSTGFGSFTSSTSFIYDCLCFTGKPFFFFYLMLRSIPKHYMWP